MNTIIGTDIAVAAQQLRSGGVVAIPTETVYGLAGDAFNSVAVASIFAAKKRPTFDPLIVHIGDRDWLPRVAREVPALAEELIARFWPGPLTVVLEKTVAVSDLVTSGLSTVAVRMPDHPLTLELLKSCGTPLAAPSANLFGRTSPTTAAHVAGQLSGRIPYILDGGPCTVGIESTIVRIVDGQIDILRPGGITAEQLRHFGPLTSPAFQTAAVAESTAACVPGQLPEHYAPRTPLRIMEPGQLISADATTGIIALHKRQLADELVGDESFPVIELSPGGDLTEAAAGFFAALHHLDSLNLQQLYVVRFPDTGLGMALNDRLRRAAHEAVHPC